MRALMGTVALLLLTGLSPSTKAQGVATAGNEPLSRPAAQTSPEQRASPRLPIYIAAHIRLTPRPRVVEPPAPRDSCAASTAAEPFFLWEEKDCTPKPLSAGQKLVHAMRNTFSLSSLTIAASGAGISQARNSDPGFGQGWDGYGKRLGDRVGGRLAKEFMGSFLIASVTRQDPQYHPSSRRGFGPRLGHALAQVVYSYRDAGGRRFNYPGVLGSAFAAGIGNAWRVESDRTAKDSATRFGLNLAFDAVMNLWREFVTCRNYARN